jgi:hypothetical protein
MKIPTLTTGFGKYSQEALLVKSQTILNSLTGSIYYTSPVPALSVLRDAIGNYGPTLAAATSKVNTQLIKQTRGVLTGVLNRLSIYIKSIAKGDAALYEMSGYSLAKTAQPVGMLPKPKKFKVSPLHTGSVKLTLKKTGSVRMYCYEYSIAGAAAPIWVQVYCTRTKAIITNLTSGAQYAFRVSGIAADPTVVYSDVILSYVS